MFVMNTTGRYWFRNGYNPNAVAATVIGGVPGHRAGARCRSRCSADSENVLLSHGGDFSWFLGCGLGFLAFWLLEKYFPRITGLEEDVELAADGTSL